MQLGNLLRANIPRSNVIASITRFPSIDIEGMAKRMRLSERAQENGTHELPATDSKDFDTVEQDIVQQIEAESTQQFDRYLDDQKTYVDRSGTLAIPSLALLIGSTADGAIVDFSNRTRNGANELYLLRKDVVETEAELQRFRGVHNLERPPRHLGPRTLKWAVLALLLLIESIANGLFLAQGSAFGLIGGVGEATVIAFINVAAGLAAGRMVLPWLTHRNWAAKIFFTTVFGAYLVFAFTFNLLVAHYRTAMGIDPLMAAEAVIRTMTSDPLNIRDIQSWLLFAVGIVFSFIAAIDGWSMDDPYPGYGRTARAHQDAAMLYTQQKAELLTELEEIKDHAQQQMDKCIRDISTRRGEYESILTNSQALQTAMAAHFDHLQTSGNTLLRVYRDENRKQRSTSPPSRFDQSWTITRPPLDQQAIPDQLRREITRALQQARTEAPERREALNSEYLKHMAEYRKIDELTAGDFAR